MWHAPGQAHQAAPLCMRLASSASPLDSWGLQRRVGAQMPGKAHESPRVTSSGFLDGSWCPSPTLSLTPAKKRFGSLGAPQAEKGAGNHMAPELAGARTLLEVIRAWSYGDLPTRTGLWLLETGES